MPYQCWHLEFCRLDNGASDIPDTQSALLQPRRIQCAPNETVEFPGLQRIYEVLDEAEIRYALQSARQVSLSTVMLDAMRSRPVAEKWPALRPSDSGEGLTHDGFGFVRVPTQTMGKTLQGLIFAGRRFCKLRLLVVAATA